MRSDRVTVTNTRGATDARHDLDQRLDSVAQELAEALCLSTEISTEKPCDRQATLATKVVTSCRDADSASQASSRKQGLHTQPTTPSAEPDVMKRSVPSGNASRIQSPTTSTVVSETDLSTARDPAPSRNGSSHQHSRQVKPTESCGSDHTTTQGLDDAGSEMIDRMIRFHLKKRQSARFKNSIVALLIIAFVVVGLGCLLAVWMRGNEAETRSETLLGSNGSVKELSDTLNDHTTSVAPESGSPLGEP